jgi:hypothetical protein
VLRVAREFENIPLGDAQVLENFPRRVLCAFRPFAAEFDGEVLEDRIEIRVSIAAFEETYDVLP